MRWKVETFFLVAGFAALSAIYIALGWSHELGSMGGDNAGYLLAAQYFSPYQPASSILTEYSERIIYPPLFPLVLAFTGGGESILAAHVVVIIFLLSAIGVLYFWLRQESLPSLLCAAVATLFALMPATYLQSFQIWTENPYIFFSLLALLAARLAVLEGSARWWWIAAAVVASATLIRVAALPLLVAFVIYLLIHRPKNYLLFAVAAGLPFLLWALLGASHQAGISAYAHHWQVKYSDAPIATLADQLHTISQRLIWVWRYAWLGDSQSQISDIIVYSFGLACFAGCALRLKALKFDAVYVVIYAAMLMAWPYLETLRYSYVIYPVFIAQGFLLLGEAAASRLLAGQSIRIASILVVVLTFSILPSLIINARLFLQEVPAGIKESKHTGEWYDGDREVALLSAYIYSSHIAHLKAIAEFVPENECIYSIKPTLVTFYSKRLSYAPPQTTVSDQQFWREMGKCRFAYLLPPSSSYTIPYYPLARLGNRTKALSTEEVRLPNGSTIIGSLVEIK